MQKTENYELNKPESTDRYNVDNFNENMDIIDTKLAECFQRGNEVKENLVSILIALGFDVDTSYTFDELFDLLETVKKGSGTAQPKHVLKPQTFTNAEGIEYVGTMEDMSGITIATASVTQDDTNTYFGVPKAGFYDENSKLYTENSNLREQNITEYYCYTNAGAATGAGGTSKTIPYLELNAEGYKTLTIDLITCYETNNYAKPYILGDDEVIFNPVTSVTEYSNVDLDISKYSSVKLTSYRMTTNSQYIRYYNIRLS